MPSRAALVRHPVAIAGAILTTVSAVVFIALTIAVLAGMFANPYAGLVVFVALPAAFLSGLLLIPLGMWLQRRKLARNPQAATDWPVMDFRLPEVRRAALIVVALTAANLVILLLAGYGSLHWMESPAFCGQVCHSPMDVQFTAWRAGPHARVACADCHIGEGTRGFVAAKLAGTRQLAHVITNRIPKPVHPGTGMAPGEQAKTCLQCHQPTHVAGDLIKVVREYADDETNTETATILQLHVGARSSTGRAIHWHADPSTQVEYVATDHGRQTIPYVRVTDAKGQVKEYRTADATDQVVNAGTRRRMDCVDCHNSVGHPFAGTPEKAVDHAIAAAAVSRDLPFARREGLRLLKAAYPTHEASASEIDKSLRAFYQSRGGAVDEQKLSRAVAGLQDAYRRSIFPAEKVVWDTYPNNIGHTTSTGCFRCHDESHTAKDGTTISGDCEYCHKQIERPAGARP